MDRLTLVRPMPTTWLTWLKQGASATKLLTKKATRKAVLDGIGDAAKNLKSGDFFFLTYSGHGGQAPDLNSEEPDGHG